MKWIKRDSACKTIQDVVLRNTPAFSRKNDVYTVKEMNNAVAVLKQFIANGRPIALVGDYDVDGICAASIIFLAITSLGGNVKVRLPRRFSEGFGLSEKIVGEISEGLLITVDNGIAAIEAVQKAKDKGLTVIITDHHLRSESGELPNADIIIDPNAVPDSADFTGYCGAGLAYKLAALLLGEGNALLPKLLSLAAIATVADVVPLVKENHSIVRNGLAAMLTEEGRTVGLGALLEVCQMDKFITAKDIAFKIAPIINASGRLHDDGANIPFALLTFEGSHDAAINMAQNINETNEQRKAIKTREMAVIHETIENELLEREVPLCVYVPGLSEGLMGIYAGELVERYKVPSLVFTDSEDPDIIKGSGRSCGGVHLKNLLDSCSDLLYKYGGHAEAAGVSVERNNFEAMKNRLMKCIGSVPKVNDNILYYDLDITVDKIQDAIREMERFAPYGEGNPEIVFRLLNFDLAERFGSCYKTMGSNGNSIRLFGKDVVAVGFGMTERYIAINKPQKVNLVGTLSLNYYQGKTNVQIEIIDIKDVDDKTSYGVRIESPLAMHIANYSAK